MYAENYPKSFHTVFIKIKQMLELSLLRENAELVIERLAIKRVDARETVKKILEADLNRRETQKLLDDNLAESNQIAREVGNLFKEGR